MKIVDFGEIISFFCENWSF